MRRSRSSSSWTSASEAAGLMTAVVYPKARSSSAVPAKGRYSCGRRRRGPRSPNCIPRGPIRPRAGALSRGSTRRPRDRPGKPRSPATRHPRSRRRRGGGDGIADRHRRRRRRAPCARPRALAGRPCPPASGPRRRDRRGELLQTSGLPPDRLALASTETSARRDPEEEARIVTASTDLGVCVALDDSGTGYWSQSRLIRRPAEAPWDERAKPTASHGTAGPGQLPGQAP